MAFLKRKKTQKTTNLLIISHLQRPLNAHSNDKTLHNIPKFPAYK